MIAGVGVDLVAVDRVRGLVERHGERFLKRCFAPWEIAARRDAEHLAGLLAVKEATFKALGPHHPSGIGWRDITVEQGSSGRPEILLGGRAREVARVAGIGAALCSISHDGGMAVAVVVLERSGPPVA